MNITDQKFFPSKLCPIGLECLALERETSYQLKDGGYCSNANYCQYWAAPWPLPFQIWEIDCFYDKGALIVSLPEFTNWEEVPDNDWDIFVANNYDAWVGQIRTEQQRAGWDNPDELPYCWDASDQALVVTEFHLIRGPMNWKEPSEGFAPAVSIGNWRARFEGYRRRLLRAGWQTTHESPECDNWGFYLSDGVPGLAWRWEEDAYKHEIPNI